MKTTPSSKFAEKQLKKFGWKEGDGIGKNNQGIADPIKASFKFDNSGVGFNLSEQFTTNWWEHLFNSTANKIDTNNKQKKSDEKVKKDEPKEDKTQTSILNRKSYFYSRFQKGNVLVGGETIKTKEIVEEENIKREKAKEETVEVEKKIVTDEDLFKLCEGRTAHKGARHGIKMNGKLARIEAAEKMLYEKLVKSESDKEKSSKKRKTESIISESNADNLEEISEDVDTDKTEHKKKKKKSKNKEIS